MLKEQLLTIKKGKGRVRLLITPLVNFILDIASGFAEITKGLSQLFQNSYENLHYQFYLHHISVRNLIKVAWSSRPRKAAVFVMLLAIVLVLVALGLGLAVTMLVLPEESEASNDKLSGSGKGSALGSGTTEPPTTEGTVQGWI